MTLLVTEIVEASDSENRRTFHVDGHTVASPRLLIQKRKEAPSVTGVASDELQIVYGTADSNGEPLSSKLNISVRVARPANARSTEVDLGVALLRDLVQSTEFDNLVSSQAYFK